METTPIRADNDAVDIRNLYRMPWKTSDNAMAWLEPTRKCRCRHSQPVPHALEDK